MLYVPEVDRWTQARNLREIETMARDLIAVMEGVPTDSFNLHVDLITPEPVAAHLARSREFAEQAATARAAAAAESRAAARELHDVGVPLRDIGELLHVSYQRAHQLVTEAKRLSTAKAR